MDFVLVHGAYHGAWCWRHLERELEHLGHRAVAPELPISEPGLGAADYAAVVAAAMDEATRPVLVAHSMAGLVAPLVATARPVRRLVFLAAFLPQPGRSANEQREAEPVDGRVPLATADWTDLGADVWSIGPATATELFYPDAPPELAAWATAQLRPQCYRVLAEPSPLEAWPSCPADYIVCRDDRSINPAWGRTAARSRLGVGALEIDGGHSPFLTRPAELARMLDGIAARS